MIEFNEEKNKSVYIEKRTLKQMMETIENNNIIIRMTETKETLLDDNQRNERLLVNIKKEEDFSCEDRDKNEEEKDHEREETVSQNLEGGGMSPVETATLLLLSRIALFNKVGNYMQIFYPWCQGKGIKNFI